MTSLTIFVFIFAILFNALASILIKASTVREDELSVQGVLHSIILNPWLISGLASFGVAFLCYRYVLGQGMKLSFAYPVMTTAGFAIVIIASRVFFNEELTLIQWVGIVVLVIGIWLITSQNVIAT